MDLIGRIIGKCRIVEKIGEGGMAVVFKAYQPALDRYLAIKILPAEYALKPELFERFAREARAVARLNHPNILPIYDFGQDEEGLSYIVMKYVAGGTLKDRLSGPLDLIEITRLVDQIAAALDHAHERGPGIIHRDVKPSNILLDEGNWALLADFGLAKILSGDEELTSAGSVMGTYSYLSPEQAQGLPLDRRTDIYSLGVTLFEMATGRRPFYADTPSGLLIKHAFEPPPSPHQINPAISEEVELVILKALAKNRADRYATAGELARALRQAVTYGYGPAETSPIAATAQSAPPRITEEPIDLAKLREKLPPWEVISPRVVAEFVGREVELKYFEEKLAALHLAVITGMPGVGKTALASKLSRRIADLDKIFWHTFHEGEDVTALIWKLAGFLAWHNQHDLWNTLQSSTLAGNSTPPVEVLLDYLLYMVCGHSYVLCFDDFQYAEDDPLLASFINRLQPALDAGEIDVLIVSQRRPAFVLEGEFNPLAGLSSADVRALLQQRGVTLSDPLHDELYAATDGNAQLIMFALDSLRNVKDSARLIRRLSESEQIERFLVREVDAGLSDEERHVLSGLAAMLGYPASRSAIMTALDGVSVRRSLNDLVSRSLVMSMEVEEGKVYTLASLVRAFYYDLLNQRDRQAIHHRLGEFYASDEPDALRAALHFQRSHEPARAASLITADIWKSINRGDAQTVRQVLESFVERDLDRAEWIEVLFARGQVLTVLGESQAARTAYDIALARLDPRQPEFYARACRGLAELLQDDAPSEAITWLQRGLELMGDRSSIETAALNIRLGRLLTFQGDYETARTLLQQGLMQLPPDPSRLRITALGNLGNIACIRGEIERGLAYYQQVVDHAQAMSDYWAMVEVWINLGIELDIAGRWDEALAQYQQALRRAEGLGSLDQQIRARLGMGNTYLKQGRHAAASEQLTHCLAMARSHQRRDLLIYAGNSWARLQLTLGQVEKAERSLDEVEQLSQVTGVREQLPETYRTFALVRLAQQRPSEALTYAGQSLTLAREFESYADEGIGLRVLGQAQWAMQQREEAASSFENSLRLLAERNPYEVALTQREWGKCLSGWGEVERGSALQREGEETLKRLGVEIGY